MTGQASISPDDLDTGADPFAGSGGFAILGTMLPTLGVAGVSLVLVAFMAYVIGQAVLGRKVSAGETWDGAKPFIGRVVGATILVGLVVSGSLLVILTLPILWLAVGHPGGGELVGAVVVLILALLVAIAVVALLATRLALVNSAIVLEGVSVTRGFSRSWRLTRPGFWRILGIRLLTSFVVGMVTQVLTFPISLIATFAVLGTGNEDQLLVVQAVVAGLTGLITAVLTTPFTAGVDALLYVDQRIRNEGLDVQLIGVTQGTAPPPWPRATS